MQNFHLEIQESKHYMTTRSKITVSFLTVHYTQKNDTIQVIVNLRSKRQAAADQVDLSIA